MEQVSMHYKDLAEFFIYARELENDIDQVLKLLCLKTLNEFELESMVYFALHSNGHLKPTSAFGINLDEMQISQESFSLHAFTPCSEAIKEQKLVFVDNFREAKHSYQVLAPLDIPPHFNSLVAFPIILGGNIFGVMLGLSPRKKVKSPQLIEVLQAIATTIGSLLIGATKNGKSHTHATSETTFVIPRAEPENQSENIREGSDLTERQRLILQMIADGRTNADIADLLGYSESLIRQETIRIYSKLSCSGRNEAAQIYRASLTGAH